MIIPSKMLFVFPAPSSPAPSTMPQLKKVMDLLVHPDAETRKEMQKMQNILEETLTKNMHLQKDLENLSQEVVRLSKMAALSGNGTS